MNGYHDKYLRLQAIEGAEDIQDYCERRRCMCHIDGLRDCPFLHKDGAHEDLYCLVGYPAKRALEGVDTR